MPNGNSVREAIEEFLFQMSANGRRPSSVAAYARELTLLRRHLRNQPLDRITAHDVSRFLASRTPRLRRDGAEKAMATLNCTKVGATWTFIVGACSCPQ